MYSVTIEAGTLDELRREVFDLADTLEETAGPVPKDAAPDVSEPGKPAESPADATNTPPADTPPADAPPQGPVAPG